MGILEILVICILSLTTNNIATSFNTVNAGDTVTNYYEVEEAEKEIVIQLPPSYFELLQENERRGNIIMGLLKENQECLDRDI